MVASQLSKEEEIEFMRKQFMLHKTKDHEAPPLTAPPRPRLALGLCPSSSTT